MDYNHSDQDTQQEILTTEICDTIADMIAFGEYQNFYECRCQTSEGNRILVEHTYTDTPGASTQTTYHIVVWANHDQSPDEDRKVLDVCIQEYNVKTLISLKSQQQEIAAERRLLGEKDEVLAKEEIDLEHHIGACARAICFGVED